MPAGRACWQVRLQLVILPGLAYLAIAVSVDAALPRGLGQWRSSNPGTADVAHRGRIEAATTAPWLDHVYTQISSWGYSPDRFHPVFLQTRHVKGNSENFARTVIGT